MQKLQNPHLRNPRKEVVVGFFYTKLVEIMFCFSECLVVSFARGK